MSRKYFSLCSAIALCLTALHLFILPGQAEAQKNKTVTVISFDGMRSDYTEQYIKDGKLPHFKKARNNGLFPHDMRTIYPSLTSASHAAIATGALPAKTGMISNNFHDSGKKLTNKENAFYSSLQAAPIWEEARKQGKTTATILFPGSNPKEGHEATYSIYYGKTWATSRLHQLKFNNADWPGMPPGFSPAKEAEFTIRISGREHTYYLLAIDSTDNGQPDYGHFYISDEKKITAKTHFIQKGAWGSCSLSPDGKETAGFHFKIKLKNGRLSGASLYRTAVASAEIKGPGQFKEEINETFGFFPIQDDDAALKRGWITRKEYEEISERFAQWTTDVSLYIKERYRPDLLFYYYPQIDHEEHQYLLVDPRQPGYTKSKSKRYMGYIDWAYQLADRQLEQTMKTLQDQELLFLVSDHGMEPVHTAITPNRELEKSGLVKRNKNGRVDVRKSKAYVIASGTTAHVYINAKGREKNGNVPKNDYKSVQKQIKQVFENLEAEEKSHIPKKQALSYLFKDWWQGVQHNKMDWPDTKEAFSGMGRLALGMKEHPLDEVLLPNSTKAKALSHERAGDVILIASKGFYFMQDDHWPASSSMELGNHGGNPARNELRPILYITGKGISKGQIDGKTTTLDIAPTLYRLLDLQEPSFTDGKPIKKVIQESAGREHP